MIFLFFSDLDWTTLFWSATSVFIVLPLINCRCRLWIWGKKLFKFFWFLLKITTVRSHDRRQNLARPAYLHLFFPFFMCCSAADGSVNEPAKLSCLKLPRRTFFFLFWGTFFDRPTRFLRFDDAPFSGQKKKHLPFHMRRHGSPALLIAVYGFDRYP